MRGGWILEQRAHRDARRAACGQLSGAAAAERRWWQLDLSAATGYLVAAQQRDGTWPDFLTLAGAGVDWPTAYVAASLPRSTFSAARARAQHALLDHQQADGGWGYNTSVPSDCDSTAYALQLLAEEPDAGSATERAMRWLVECQHASGGFATYARAEPIRAFMNLPSTIRLDGWTQPHCEVTAACGAALALAVSPDHPVCRAVWGFLASAQRADGLWTSYWWSTDLYATAQAVRLARALPVDAARSAAVEAAIKATLVRQREDGAWCDDINGQPSVFATALAISIIASAPGVEPARRWLIERQRPDGSWDSDPILRIPPPMVANPRVGLVWRVDGLGTGVVVRDQNRLYTTATVVRSLGRVDG